MIKVYVMRTCPDCTQIKKAVAGDPRFALVDIGEHVRHLKEFLKLRDNHPQFETARRSGLVGIPSFLLEDGRVTFRAQDTGLDLDAAKEDGNSPGAACSLDGTGC